jgi:hypothetical protein
MFSGFEKILSAVCSTPRCSAEIGAGLWGGRSVPGLSDVTFGIGERSEIPASQVVGSDAAIGRRRATTTQIATRLGRQYGTKLCADKQAFKDEAQAIRDAGGIKDPNSLNKIYSPGEKMLPPPPRAPKTTTPATTTTPPSQAKQEACNKDGCWT